MRSKTVVFKKRINTFKEEFTGSKVSKSSYNSILELSFVLVRLAVRYLNLSLPNPIPCVLVILEVISKPTEQPRFLPWEFDTQLVKFWY